MGRAHWALCLHYPLHRFDYSPAKHLGVAVAVVDGRVDWIVLVDSHCMIFLKLVRYLFVFISCTGIRVIERKEQL